MITTAPAEPPIRPTTRALAAMQTAINAVGLRLFEGDLDRFVIFSLIVAQTFPTSPDGRPIAVYSLAMSLERPFETVRRHVNALIDHRLCDRVDGGVVARPDVIARPGFAVARDVAHDAFVGFVEDMQRLGLVPPLPAATQPYDPMAGVAASVDTMLMAVSSNRDLHDDWLSLSIFSTVVLANATRYEAAGEPAGTPLGPAHAIRMSAVARSLALPESTTRRRVALLLADRGPLIRTSRGLLASSTWLGSSAAAATSANTYAGIRLILARAAARGFPFDDPASAYLVGRPAPPRFA